MKNIIYETSVVRQFLLDHNIPSEMVSTIIKGMRYTDFKQLYLEVVHYQRLNAEADAHILHVDKLIEAANGEIVVDALVETDWKELSSIGSSKLEGTKQTVR